MRMAFRYLLRSTLRSFWTFNRFFVRCCLLLRNILSSSISSRRKLLDALVSELLRWGFFSRIGTIGLALAAWTWATCCTLLLKFNVVFIVILIWLINRLHHNLLRLLWRIKLNLLRRTIRLKAPPKLILMISIILCSIKVLLQNVTWLKRAMLLLLSLLPVLKVGLIYQQLCFISRNSVVIISVTRTNTSALIYIGRILLLLSNFNCICFCTTRFSFLILLAMLIFLMRQLVLMFYSWGFVCCEHIILGKRSCHEYSRRLAKFRAL